MPRPMFRIFSGLRPAVKFILLAAMPLLAASCAADLNPSPMPTGYKYNGQQYNTPYSGPVKQMSYPGMGMPTTGPRPAPGDLTTPMAPAPDATPAPLAPATGPMPVYHSEQQSAVTPGGIAPGAGGPDPVETARGPMMRQAAGDLLARTERDFGRIHDAVYIRPPGSPDEAVFAQALNDTMRQRHYKISPDLQKSAFVADYRIGGGDAGATDVELKINGQDGRTLQAEKGGYTMAATPAMADAAPVGHTPVGPAATAPVTAMAPATMAAAQAPAPSFWTGRSAAPAQAMAQPVPPQPAPMPPAQARLPDTQPVAPVAAAPPPPLPPQIPPSAGSVSVSDGKTYIYDGRATKPAGHTAYEQMQGVEHVVGKDDVDYK